MKFKLYGLYCSQIKVVDDAESTPGESRMIQRFRRECYEPIVKAMMALKPAEKNTCLADVWQTVNEVLKTHHFKIEESCFHTNERDGLEQADFEISSEE